MDRRTAGHLVLGAGLCFAQACGGSDDSGLAGSGGSSTGGASTGGSSTGGASTGGSSAGGSSSGGSSTGGVAGADASAGGSATGGAPSGGASSGGSGGSSSGGSSSGGSSSGGTSSGGTGGGNTGGAGGWGSAGCPTTPPAPGTSCTSAGAVCCYGPSPLKPLRCVPQSIDGGGPYAWVTLQSKVCCPALPPTSGAECNAPGDLKCCYGNAGFYCNAQPSPDVWASTTCN